VISPSQRPLPTRGNTTYRHTRQTSMPSAGFEPAIPATKRPQTYALDRGHQDRRRDVLRYGNSSAVTPCCNGLVCQRLGRMYTLHCCTCLWGKTVSLNCGHQRAYCSSPDVYFLSISPPPRAPFSYFIWGVNGAVDGCSSETPVWPHRHERQQHFCRNFRY
jgi:hypothetical protein